MLFVIIIASGIWLSKAPRPLNGIVLAVHKLVTVAVLVFLAVTCYQMNAAVALSQPDLAVVAATVLFFLGAIASGGFLSTESPMPPVVLIVHRVTAVATVLSTGILMVLLKNRM